MHPIITINKNDIKLNIILGVKISFEGLTKDVPPKTPPKLICKPNISLATNEIYLIHFLFSIDAHLPILYCDFKKSIG